MLSFPRHAALTTLILLNIKKFYCPASYMA